MMAVNSLPVRLIVNEREYALLRGLLLRHASQRLTKREADHDGLPVNDHTTAAFRSATRVYILTYSALKVLAKVLERVAARRDPTAPRRKPLVASPSKMALSMSSLLFFHATLYRLFSRLRLQLLHEKVQSIRQRYPKIYAAMTAKIAPAIAASLSGLALGINPADQLRVSIAIYVGCRALESGYAAVEHTKLMSKKPSWVGSWMLFALSYGQMFHAFVFDRECAPPAYGSFVLGFTPEYIQPRPGNVASWVRWPTSEDVVDALAQMSRLKWPTFDSPILRPKMANTLPAGVDQIITPITSRAHPGIQHLSCALIHPSDPSCFMACLRQILLSFPLITKFFTKYYGALALLRISSIVKAPLKSLNKLSESVLRTSVAITGSVGASWGAICLFQAFLPRAMLPRFRFFLGGLLGGMFAFFDRTANGHANALYASRMSVDSLWKVGVKRKWWRGIKGGDVWFFVASLALINIVYDMGRNTAAGKDRALMLVKLLRGDIELGLRRKAQKVTKPEDEKTL